MTLDPGLLAAIIAEPNDDLLRLVAADWFDEHGQSERAEFVRVQVELAKSSSCVYDATNGFAVSCRCTACLLRQRERELLASGDGSKRTEFAGGRRVLEQRTDWMDIAWAADDCRFHRGFVSQLTITWQGWQRYAYILLAACPIRNARDGLVKLTDWPIQFGVSLALLDNRWPGVRFELPTAIRDDAFARREEREFTR